MIVENIQGLVIGYILGGALVALSIFEFRKITKVEPFRFRVSDFFDLVMSTIVLILTRGEISGSALFYRNRVEMLLAFFIGSLLIVGASVGFWLRL